MNIFLFIVYLFISYYFYSYKLQFLNNNKNLNVFV